MKSLKRLTVKAVFEGERFWDFDSSEEIGTERLLMTVYGRADKVETDEKLDSLSGDVRRYMRFRGDFAAYRGPVGEGEQYRASVMVLPELAAGLLADLLSSDEVNSANFAFQIGLKKTARPYPGALGIQYTAMPLIEVSAQADPLAAVESQIKDQQLRPSDISYNALLSGADGDAA